MPPPARASLPLAPLVLGLLGGLACALTVNRPGLLVPALVLLLVLGLWSARLRVIAWALGLGLLLGLGQAGTGDRPVALELPSVHVVRGVVVRADLPERSVQGFRLARASIEAPGGREFPLPDLEAALALRGPVEGLPDLLTPGLRVRAEMSLRAARGPFEQGRAAIHGFLTDRRALSILPDDGNATARLARARTRAAATLDAGLAPPDAGLARALLLGDRTHLYRSDRALFRETGQAHLLAVSGLHVGLLLTGFLLLVRRLGAPRRLTLVLGIGAAGLYVPFTGAPPSAVRAGIGVSVWMLARLLGRQPAGLGVLTLVGTVLLLHAPGSALEPAFQLSFSAVLGILLLCRPIRGALVRPRPVLPGLIPPVRAPLRTAFSVGLSAWLGTAPFVALHMQRLCPAGPVIALPALPLTACLLASGFASILLTGVPWLAGLVGWVFEASADILRTWLGFTRDLGFGARGVAAPGPLWFGAYGLGFLVIARGDRRRVLLGLGWLACLVAVLLVRGATTEQAPVRVPRGYDPAGSSMLATALDTAPSLSHFVAAAVGLTVFAALAVRPLGWLRPGGACAAWLLGVGTMLMFSWPGLAALFAPFVVATLLGKLPGAERAGARSWVQVASNGAAAAIGCVLALAGYGSLGGVVFLGGLACLGSDTCATEIGMRFGGRTVRLLGGGPIVRGESGGVTAAGLLASVFGAGLAPLAGLAVLHANTEAPFPWLLFSLLATAGFVGALIDSVLGGSLQYRGRDPQTGALTEKRRIDGRATEHVSGLRWLDNDAVNLVSGLAAGLVAGGLLGWIR